MKLLTTVLALIPFTLAATGTRADQAPGNEPPTRQPGNSLVDISTVDAPAPYRRLDWFSASELEKIPPAQRPALNGVCEGAYLAPVIGDPGKQQNPKNAPIEATADYYQTDNDGTISLSGDVIIQQGNRQLESDLIQINQHTRETRLNGHVRIRQEGMLMVGEKADVNLNSKSLSLENAEYVVHESRIRGNAAHIYNEDQNILIFKKSSYTTCAPDSNAWLFQADTIRLNQGSGWGTAKHAVIRVKDVPVFYFPWLMFPIDDRRQTGFLFPSFGSDNENGTQITQPYYINLAPDFDATLTPRHMTRRGTQLEGEFRYLTAYGEGELGVAYLPSDDAFNDESRELNLWQHSGYFAKRWSANVDYQRVSDDDYFEDLATGLNAKSQTHLNQSAGIGYSTANWHINLRVQAYQTLDKFITDDNLPYRKVPQFTLNGDWGIGKDTGFRFIWNSEAVHFEHPEDDYNGITEANRITLAPGIEYQYRQPWVQITPRLTLIHSDYDLTSDTANNSLHEDQTLYTASLDTRLFFERQLTLGATGNSKSYTQTLEPRFFYLYTPFKQQNHRQTFDTGRINFDYYQLFRENRFTGADRYGDANQISLGLTTRLLDNETGQERFRASMGQIFYLQDRKVQLGATDSIEDHRRSAWVGQAQWHINQHWWLRSDLQWNETVNNIDKTSASLHYRNNNGALFNLGYRYLDSGAVNFSNVEKIKQSDLSFVWPVKPRWSLVGRWEYDLEYDRSFENLIGVEYDSCCWRVRLVNRRYLREDNDDPLKVEPQRGIFLQFQLKGLGGVGTELDSILNESIRGFKDREQLKSNNY